MNEVGLSEEVLGELTDLKFEIDSIECQISNFSISNYQK